MDGRVSCMLRRLGGWHAGWKGRRSAPAGCNQWWCNHGATRRCVLGEVGNETKEWRGCRGGVFSLRSLAGFLTITWGAGTGCLGLGRRHLAPHLSAPSVVPAGCGADTDAELVAASHGMAADNSQEALHSCMHGFAGNSANHLLCYARCKPSTQPTLPYGRAERWARQMWCIQAVACISASSAAASRASGAGPLPAVSSRLRGGCGMGGDRRESERVAAMSRGRPALARL